MLGSIVALCSDVHVLFSVQKKTTLALKLAYMSSESSATLIIPHCPSYYSLVNVFQTLVLLFSPWYRLNRLKCLHSASFINIPRTQQNL